MEEKIIINAEGLILGRLSSYIAKQLLLGKNIIVYNAEEIVISGNKNDIIEREKQKMQRGSNINKGPYYQRRPSAYFKKTVKRMLPKNKRGEEALKKLKVYSRKKDLEMNINLDKIRVEKLPNVKFITLKELSKHLGITQ